MTLVEILGWTATVVGTVLAMPQLVRLARTRNIEGLSLVGWQTALVLNIAWTVHGITIGQLPQILSSSLALFTTVPILVLMSRELGRRILPTVAPSLVIAAVMISVDLGLGSAAYGIVAIFPGIAITAAQSVELVRADHVRGVSPVSLSLGFINLTLWGVWALLVNDSGTMIAISTTWFVAVFNISWYVARRFGLRPFFVRTSQAEPEPVLVAACQEA
ncbi:MAG TPA: PQ-loop domain-containing transporter [Propionicimonas sp.]|nr:PQ-loop domain-containing transporter [Propionicimonas sp.]